eukprot:9496245-Pyramimonas_sp.AAC.1
MLRTLQHLRAVWYSAWDTSEWEPAWRAEAYCTFGHWLIRAPGSVARVQEVASSLQRIRQSSTTNGQPFHTWLPRRGFSGELQKLLNNRVAPAPEGVAPPHTARVAPPHAVVRGSETALTASKSAGKGGLRLAAHASAGQQALCGPSVSPTKGTSVHAVSTKKEAGVGINGRGNGGAVGLATPAASKLRATFKTSVLLPAFPSGRDEALPLAVPPPPQRKRLAFKSLSKSTTNGTKG